MYKDCIVENQKKKRERETSEHRGREYESVDGMHRKSESASKVPREGTRNDN